MKIISLFLLLLFSLDLDNSKQINSSQPKQENVINDTNFVFGEYFSKYIKNTSPTVRVSTNGMLVGYVYRITPIEEGGKVFKGNLLEDLQKLSKKAILQGNGLNNLAKSYLSPNSYCSYRVGITGERAYHDFDSKGWCRYTKNIKNTICKVERNCLDGIIISVSEYLDDVNLIVEVVPLYDTFTVMDANGWAKKDIDYTKNIILAAAEHKYQGKLSQSELDKLSLCVMNKLKSSYKSSEFSQLLVDTNGQALFDFIEKCK